MSVKRPRHSKIKTPRNGQKVIPTGGENEPSESGTGLDNEGFVVDLFLDKKRQVRLTQILHVKSNDGEAWEGWDEKRLIGFFIDRAKLSLPEPIAESTVIASLVEPPGDHEKSAAAMASQLTEGPAEKLIERGVEVIPFHSHSAARVLTRGEPFDVRLLLGDTNLFTAGETELGYSVSISAYNRGQHAKYFIALDRGMIKSTDEVIQVNIPKQNLEPGTYSLRADIAVTTPGQPEEEIQPHLIASLNLRSRLLQVI